MSRSTEEECQVIVPDNIRPDRADKILARLKPEISRSRWQKLFQEGHVWSDDRALSQKDRIRSGDCVQYTLPAPVPLKLNPVLMDLSILYEDGSILVLDKAAGQVVHPGAGTGEDTLVHGILHHCQESLSGIGGVERPGIVHRLDKETSGVLVVAKNDEAHQSISRQFAGRLVRKFYIALVVGVPDPASGRIEDPIGRHPVHRTRMACLPEGRAARTDFETVETYGSTASLVRLRIHTGRTHQIRVHMKQIGHPLLGDRLYGFKPSRINAGEAGASLDIPRVMLHAARLEFTHPRSGEVMRVEAPMPEDFLVLISRLQAVAGTPESR